MTSRRFSRKKRSASKKHHNFQMITGKVVMARDGSALVLSDTGLEIFVRPKHTCHALNEDRVRVEFDEDKPVKKRIEGKIVSIISRSNIPFVGFLHIIRDEVWVIMQSKSMPYDIVIDCSESQLEEYKKFNGLKVSVMVDHWKRNEPSPVGHIVDILGKDGDNETEMRSILSECGLPYIFGPEVLDEIENIPLSISEEEISSRRDLRSILTFTIDPTDAKDFDDALSFRQISSQCYEVGVHIADVSHYVKPYTKIDKEAYKRGNSVYLVDRTVPMLPEALSNNLCSLRPNEDRLTYSVIFQIDDSAQVKDYWIGGGVINSDYRLDYSKAQSLIDGSDSDELSTVLKKLNCLSQELRKKRYENGAIVFERAEVKVKIDQDKRPVEIYKAYPLDSNSLIEEFMLLANRTVAQHVAKKTGFPFVYRIHDTPNTQKLESFRTIVGQYGYKFGKIGEGKSLAKKISEVFETFKGRPEFDAIEIYALRSMAKAVYSAENIGHYGLAFKYYTHFTSPIRRYADLEVHRLLSMLDGNEKVEKSQVERICRHCSEREGVAVDAERLSVKYKMVEFVQDKIGRVFEGVITSITEWGIYVEIIENGIEGLIHVRNIKHDYFEYDADSCMMKGRDTGIVYRIGQSVKIKIISASLELKQIDFEMAK